MSSPKLAECPLCGYSAGVYIVAKTDCSGSTPVRCLFCRGQAPLNRWLKAGKPGADRNRGRAARA